MLSVQSRGSHQRNDSESYKRNSQLSPISDTDITFDFNVEEDKTDRSVRHYTIIDFNRVDISFYQGSTVAK